MPKFYMTMLGIFALAGFAQWFLVWTGEPQAVWLWCDLIGVCGQ